MFIEKEVYETYKAYLLQMMWCCRANENKQRVGIPLQQNVICRQ